MPSAYTHYRFGKEVLSCLPSRFRKTIEQYMDLYHIGLHGPDILFYYHPLTSNPINKTGYDMHDEYADQFFKETSELWKTSANQEALKAYLYGFVCHFTLDSTCHPYIEKIIQVTGLSHAEIETELDRHFMVADQIDPAVYIPIRHIHATDFNSRVIAPCLDPISAQEVKEALKGMITCHKLMHAPRSFKRNILYTGLRLTGNYDSMQGLIMKPKSNDLCTSYCRILNSHYLEAVTTAASLIQQYAGVLENGSALCSRFHMTFGAGENWEELYI